MPFPPFTVGTPNPGHSWAQMECNANSLCIDTTNGYIGIGMSTPGARLSFPNLNASTAADGITWYSPTPTSYGIYKSAGDWTAPYQQLTLKWLTGIVLDGGSAYGKSGTILQPTGGNVGIGTTTPTQKLEVNGNILASGTGDICNGSGKCLSSVFQTNVISGTNPTCPAGQTAIMKAYNGTWYTASQPSSWSQVVCGQVMSSDGTTLLVNSQHSTKNCTDAGGTVIGDGSGNNMCRLNAASCPATWNQYQYWATVSARQCYEDLREPGSTSCTTGGHAWENNATQSYTCTYKACGGGGACAIRSCGSSISQIGCY